VESPDFQGEVECPDCGAKMFVAVKGGSVQLVELREEDLEFEEDFDLSELEGMEEIELEDVDFELEEVELEEFEPLDDGLEDL